MPRAGTTYLYHAFAAHPEAFVPYRKELRYFGQQFAKGPDWYGAFFKDAPSASMCIDCSPDYFLLPEVPQRIKDTHSTARAILGIRDPASWALSLHQQVCNIGETTPTLHDFLAEMRYPSFGAENAFPAINLGRGFIRSEIEAFRHHLGPRLLMFNFEAFGRNPLHILRGIERFLSLTPYFDAQNLPQGHINAGSRKKSGWFAYVMSRDRTIRMLRSIFPKRLLLQTRLAMDRMNRTPTGLTFEMDSEEFRLCAETLAADRTYIRELFQGGNIIDGTGAVMD